MYLIDHYAPVLARVLELFGEDGAARQHDYDSLRHELVTLIEAAASACSDMADTPQCRNATFAVVAFVDEQVLSSDWNQRHQWAAQLLQKAYFNTTNAGVQFFEYLDQLNAFNPRERDVQEVFFYCLCLGFQGRYYRPDEQAILNRIQARCADELGASHSDERLFPEAYPQERPRDYAPPTRSTNLQPLYIGLPLVALLGLFLIFRHDIARLTQDFMLMI